MSEWRRVQHFTVKKKILSFGASASVVTGDWIPVIMHSQSMHRRDFEKGETKNEEKLLINNARITILEYIIINISND